MIFLKKKYSRARRDYWEHLNPSTGRPYSAALSKPDNWGVTKGSEELKQVAERNENTILTSTCVISLFFPTQHTEETTDKELAEVQCKNGGSGSPPPR